MANHEEIRRVIRHVEEHPKTHDQAVWLAQNNHCGTTACLAGWAAILNGWVPVWEVPDDVPMWMSAFGGVQIPMDRTSVWLRPHVVNVDTGEVRRVDAVATEVFDLNYHQALRLFRARSLDELKKVAHEIEQLDARMEAIVAA